MPAPIHRDIDRDSLKSVLRREQSFVENLLQSSIKVVSWHNPDHSNLLDFEADEIAGLTNVTGTVTE